MLLLISGFGFYTEAQDIEVITHETFLSDTLGAEMVFEFEIVNISNVEQTVFEVRTINDLPPNWVSSLCFGQNCFPPSFDSVATTPDFNTPPLAPGDTLLSSLHVTALVNDGIANVQIQAGTFHNPNDRITIDFEATTLPVSVDGEKTLPGQYFLAQNYPNPFNPSTKIKFGLKDASVVSLKVYDILGNEVATLINEFRDAGDYEVNFNSVHLSSGIYFYKLTANGFAETRKMILEK
ncbi:MAG TPA: T9SS type A sorting domain-containing protein [Ignavibacteriales bacterium]|nr:T9SS type A sorting domain-containing protein [Ignavibacteriales bacterium]